MTLQELNNLLHKVPEELNCYEVVFISPYWENNVLDALKADFIKQQIILTGKVITTQENE